MGVTGTQHLSAGSLQRSVPLQNAEKHWYCLHFRKVEQVSEELDIIRASLDKYGSREQRRQR
jgi:hypothetical protein